MQRPISRYSFHAIAFIAVLACWIQLGTADSNTVRRGVPMKVHPFDLKQVRLLDGPFKRAMELDRGYLYALDSDRLLHAFRVNAGLPTAAEPLGGWERPDCEVRGHTMGHYLSACALMYASAGDEKLKAKADAIVTALGPMSRSIGRQRLSQRLSREFYRARRKSRKRMGALLHAS